MKKFAGFVFSLLLIFSQSVLWSQQAGTLLFDGANPVVIDVASLGGGKLSDEIHVHNATRTQTITVQIQGFETKKSRWGSLGNVTVKKINGENELEKKLKKYSSFSILPSIDYPVQVSAKIEDKYLHVFFKSVDEVGPQAFAFDSLNVPGAFKDNIRFHNKSMDSGLSFDLYARMSLDAPWEKVGSAFLKGFGDADTVDSSFPIPIASYRYFAVIAQNGKPYRYLVSKERNDLYISVYPN